MGRRVTFPLPKNTPPRRERAIFDGSEMGQIPPNESGDDPHCPILSRVMSTTSSPASPRSHRTTRIEKIGGIALLLCNGQRTHEDQF